MYECMYRDFYAVVMKTGARRTGQYRHKYRDVYTDVEARTWHTKFIVHTKDYDSKDTRSVAMRVSYVSQQSESIGTATSTSLVHTYTHFQEEDQAS